MAVSCLNPTLAWYDPEDEDLHGSITFNEEKSIYFRKSMSIPCGKCVKCVSKKLNEWGIRCTHEMSLHKQNSFITLTYAPENMPADGNLVHRDFQLFIKRLRKHLKGKKVRYIMCGEYGKKSTKRPHFHLILFGHDFSEDRTVLKVRKTPSGRKVTDYISPTLEKLWPYGHHLIGNATYQTARYVAKYSLKTESKQDSERVPEYKVMSNGIGKGWALKNKFQIGRDGFVYQADSIKKQPIPRYYKQFLSDEHQEKLQQEALYYVENKKELTLQEEKASYLTQRQRAIKTGNIEVAKKLDGAYRPHLDAREEVIDSFGVDIGPIDRPTLITLKDAPEHLVKGIDYEDNNYFRKHNFTSTIDLIDVETGELHKNVRKSNSVCVCYSR